MKEGLNLNELYQVGAHSIIESIKNDCSFYNIEIEKNENIRFTGVIIYDKNSMLVDFDVWNGKEWQDAKIPYAFNKEENEELFLDIIEEAKNITELKDFVEHN